MSRRVPLLTVAALLAPLGCDAPLPSAQLSASPTEGRAPFEVTLDASASEDPRGEALQYRFDVDGDGVWDSELSAESRVELTLERGGVFVPRVLVVSESGQAVGTADVSIRSLHPLADVDVDTNRDGVIDEADKAEEDLWTDSRGAVFLSNWDDDDHDGYRDAHDGLVNGERDLADLTRVVLRHSPDLAEGAEVTIEVGPQPADARVRLFERKQLDVVKDLDARVGAIDAAALREGDVELFLEGVGGRSANWDGRVTLTMRVEADGESYEDVVELRAAPTIFPDNTRAPERLYVMRVDGQGQGANLAFYNALVDGLPEDIELYTVEAWDYYADRWLQDSMQTGYQRVPTADGVKMQQNYLMTERISGYGLENLIPEELLGQDFGFAYTGGQPSSLNYGGNLEITPPHAAHGNEFRFGRVMVGGGDTGTVLGGSHADHMTTPQKQFLAAQEVQGPLIELSTEWLAVGHLDEIFLFVPDLHREGRPWRVVVASPAAARAELMQLVEQDKGDLPVFDGRPTETTVAAIVENDDLMAYNAAVQARIDDIIDQLMAEMELTEEDLIEVPVLYEPHYSRGKDFSAAYSPGMQNLMVAGDKLFIPDPEGPDAFGKDVWQGLATANLAPTGLALEYVDVFESYHLLLGEAHCGSNFQRAPFEAEWWTP